MYMLLLDPIKALKLEPMLRGGLEPLLSEPLLYYLRSEPMILTKIARGGVIPGRSEYGIAL